MSARVPDVILLTALMSPRDEDELIAHLRTLNNVDHVQTHTIPKKKWKEGYAGGAIWSTIQKPSSMFPSR